jgi:hypothetical protein
MEIFIRRSGGGKTGMLPIGSAHGVPRNPTHLKHKNPDLKAVYSVVLGETATRRFNCDDACPAAITPQRAPCRREPPRMPLRAAS